MSAISGASLHPNVRPPSSGGSTQNSRKAPWYVAYTRPRQEAIAEQNLLAQDFHVYLPLYKAYKKQQAVLEPMFPRYIFFRPSRPQQSIATVKSTRGVTCLIMFGPEMAIMREQTLDAIRSLEQQRNSLDLGELSPLKPGRRVRIRDSAFEGMEGLVHAVSSRRVILLLEILGQERFLTVCSDSIELADERSCDYCATQQKK